MNLFKKVAQWSRCMISAAGGPGFNSRLNPILFCLLISSEFGCICKLNWNETYCCPLSGFFLKLVTSLQGNFKGISTADDWHTVENSSRMDPDSLRKIGETTLLLCLPVDRFHGSYFTDRIFAANDQVPFRIRFLFLRS